MIKLLLTVFISIGFYTGVLAQTMLADTAADKGVISAVDYFNKQIGEQAEIYNGPEYNFLPRATKGTPYFENRFEFTNNNIKYNGTWYGHIPILYDTYKDVLIGTQPQNQAKFIFKREYLTEFFVFGYHFIHIDAIDQEKQHLPDGYYELLYAGKSKVICKQAKTRIETVNVHGVEVVFDDKQSYYINKNGVYYSVSSKSSVLNVFKDKKKELNSYISRNNIDYKENKGLAIARLAAYYDEISK